MGGKIVMEARCKQAKDENFTVGKLVSSKDRPLVMKYYKFARYCDDIADDPKMSKEEKLAKLKEAEDVLYGKAGESELAFISELREAFLKENFSFSLASDLLKAFRQDASGFEYKTWAQLTDYCQHSAVPVGRFMLALSNENPSTYIPAAALCTALQIVNHIQDIRYDAELLDRVYVPEELLKKFGVARGDLKKNKSTPELKKLIEHMLEEMRGLIKDAASLPSIISSARLRCEVCVIISLTNMMIKRIENGDVLSKHIKLSKTDWLRAMITGIAKGLFTKRRIAENQRL